MPQLNTKPSGNSYSRSECGTINTRRQIHRIRDRTGTHNMQVRKWEEISDKCIRSTNAYKRRLILNSKHILASEVCFAWKSNRQQEKKSAYTRQICIFTCTN